jgi:hypothetical protein
MFKFVETADGSPSLRIMDSDQTESESMHSLRGAFSETVYIYGAAIETCFSRDFNPRILSVGLGLGYVEILSAALSLKLQLQPEHATVPVMGESFELVPDLRRYFQIWLSSPHSPGGSSPSPGLPIEFKTAYESILERTAEATGQAAAKIHAHLSLSVERGHWLIKGPLEESSVFENRFGCICFDAFSSKSTPALWSEDFLTTFLEKVADDSCVLSTYACTGALKRSLRSAGFDVSIREGFSSKRDSTFAVKSLRL